jgi:hypothetical protein
MYGLEKLKEGPLVASNLGPVTALQYEDTGKGIEYVLVVRRGRINVDALGVDRGKNRGSVGESEFRGLKLRIGLVMGGDELAGRLLGLSEKKSSP